MSLWGSGNINRWHSHPNHALRNSGDTVWAHAARCTVLLFETWPGSDSSLARAVLLHDAAEIMTGDVPSPAKAVPIMRLALYALENDFADENGFEQLTKQDRDKIRFVDLLDAYLWARSVDPAEVERASWNDARKELAALAESLGAHDVLSGHGVSV